MKKRQNEPKTITPQLQGAALNITADVMVSTVTFPGHPVEKEETNGNKTKTQLHCHVHTSNPLGEQNVHQYMKYKL